MDRPSFLHMSSTALFRFCFRIISFCKFNNYFHLTRLPETIMKRSLLIAIYSCLSVVLAISSGCKEPAVPKDAPPPGDTSVTIERPLGYKLIDSATAVTWRNTFLARNKNNDMYINDIHTSEFDGAYVIQFGPVQSLADENDMLLFNGESPDAPSTKVFTLVSADADFKPISNDKRNCLLQNKTGICPGMCDVHKLNPPDDRTVNEITKFVNTLYKNTEKTKALNAVQIDRRSIANFDDGTAFLQMVWGMATDSSYTLQISACTLEGEIDYTQPVISIPQQHIKREKL
jgi:hypothetical protein